MDKNIMDIADKATRSALRSLGLSYPVSKEDFEDMRQAAAETLAKLEDKPNGYKFKAAMYEAKDELILNCWGKNPLINEDLPNDLIYSKDSNGSSLSQEAIERAIKKIEKSGSKKPERDAQILAILAQGGNVRTVAQELSMSERVARSLKDRILRRLKNG